MRRRIEIHIERRELSLLLRPAEERVTESPPVVEGDRARCHPPPGHAPEACPVCGSTELLSLADAAGLASFDPRSLQSKIQEGEAHLHCSPSGDWWICTKFLPPVQNFRNSSK